MSPNLTIGAVVTNFNYQDYVGQALDALLSQTVSFDQVVVVDDGSSDDSVAVVSSYASRGVVLIEQANSGQMQACRRGLEECSTDLVYFLDADDLPLPDMVAEVLRFANMSAAKVQFMMEGIDDAGERLSAAFPALESDYGSAEMRQDNDVIGFYRCPPTSGNVFARWALERLPLETVDARESIDGAVMLAMPYLGEVISVPRTLAKYRVHGRNKSLTQSDLGGEARTGRVALKSRLEFEAARLRQRWTWVRAALGDEIGPQPDPACLFVSERMLMCAALDRDAGRIRRLAPFLRSLAGSSLPTSHKVVYACWASVCALPLGAASVNAVMWRREASSRPAWLRRLVDRISSR